MSLISRVPRSKVKAWVWDHMFLDPRWNLEPEISLDHDVCSYNWFICLFPINTTYRVLLNIDFLNVPDIDWLPYDMWQGIQCNVDMLENYQMIESQSALCEVVSYRRTLCITWSINPLKVFLQFAVNYSEYQRKCTENGQKAKTFWERYIACTMWNSKFVTGDELIMCMYYIIMCMYYTADIFYTLTWRTTHQ